MASFTAFRFPAILNVPDGLAPFSRFQLYLPRRLSLARVRIDSLVLGLASSSLASPVILASNKVEAKAVLTLFLKKQGLSDAAAESTVNKSGLFIDHLVSRLPSISESQDRVGQELSTIEISDALTPYLESIVEEHGELLIDFVEKFQKPQDEGKPGQTETRHTYLFRLRVQKALERIHKRDADGTLHPTIVYLMELGMDLEQIEQMARLYPPTPFLSVEQKLIPIVDFLLDLGLSKSEVPSILAKAPKLCGISETLKSRLAFLESFGVEKRKWASAIYRDPLILAASRKKIEAAVSFLNEMGVSDENVGKILTRCPNLARCSVEDNLRLTAEYFRSLGVDVTQVLRQHPIVFTLSNEKHVRPIVEFFLEKGFSNEELAEMITRFGGIFTFKLTTLSNKFDYFLTMGYSIEELARFPDYFCYSVEKRVKPRFELVTGSGLRLTLHQLLNVPDDLFYVRLKNKIEKLRTGKMLSECN